MRHSIWPQSVLLLLGIGFMAYVTWDCYITVDLTAQEFLQTFWPPLACGFAAIMAGLFWSTTQASGDRRE